MLKTVVLHICVGMACGLAGFLFTLIPPGELLEMKGYDLLHVSRQSTAAAGNIVLVAIDEPSFAELGKQWPWPRSMHAGLLDALKKAGAAVIAFDVLFPEASQPKEDRVFADALRRNAPVVLVSDMNVSGNGRFQQTMLVEPLQLFSQQALTGLAGIQLDRDYTVRRFPERPAGEKLFSEQIAGAFAGSVRQIPPRAWIAYTAPPDRHTTVSYYQALNPAAFLPPETFKGKIVIVGRSTSASTEPDKGQADYFSTPFLFSSRNQLMSGMEIHANLVSGFLRGWYVDRLDAALQCALFLFVGAIGGLLQLAWRPLRGFLATLSLATVYGMVVYVSFEQFRFWLPTFGILLTLLFVYTLAGARAYILIERKKRQLRRAFSHYLSPSILASVLADPDSLVLGGNRVEATMLFSDIAGFTTLSEQRRPEEISQLINIYMTAMTGIILKNNGTIDKFIGDAIMAFWGAPANDPEHALNACKAAVAMQERLQLLNVQLKEMGLPELEIRIGINSGSVIAGNMGSDDLFDYTVLGDAVNLASRLEGANKEFGTHTMISQWVLEKVSGRVDVRPLGSIKVKGKSEKTDVFELTGICDAGADKT
ncbi:MAG TPA: adenylate/guanylate cyclase domain-containing protein [Desulfuromonadales bacterium]|nr:adenylate/guanylate cyclase domain-containing protein [Desulfuromonadales bacterium]